MLYQGLQISIFHDDTILRNILLNMIKKHFFYEYSNLLTNEFLDKYNFSSNATLTKEILYEKNNFS